MSDMSTFIGALACFVVELVFFGVIVTLFVMGHVRRAWTSAKLSGPSNRNTNQVTG